MRALLALVALTGTAAADDLPTIDSTHTPALRVATHAYQLRAVTLDVHGGDTPSWLAIATTHRGLGGDTLALDVPKGTWIAGFGVRDSDGALFWGHELAATFAHDEMRAKRGDAPALVEYTSSSGDVDHLTITVDEPGTLELAVFFPKLDALAIDGAVTGAPFAKGVADLRSIAPAPTHTGGLDADVSLFASVGSRIPVVIGSPTTSVSDDFGRNDRKSIRRVVKGRLPALEHCYMLEAQRDPALRDRDTQLHFLIGSDGSVQGLALDNVPASVAPCWDAEIRTWEFAPESHPTAVNYPIRLRVLE